MLKYYVSYGYMHLFLLGTHTKYVSKSLCILYTTLVYGMLQNHVSR